MVLAKAEKVMNEECVVVKLLYSEVFAYAKVKFAVASEVATQ